MKLIGTTITKRIELTFAESNYLKSLFTRHNTVNQAVIDFFYNTNLEMKFITAESSLPHVVTAVVSDNEITISERANYMNSVWEITFVLTLEPELNQSSSVIKTNV